MAIRVIYYRKCFDCGYQDAEDNKQNVIFNRDIDEEIFQGLSTEELISFPRVYLELNEIKCPSCGSKNFLLSFDGAENFYMPKVSSYADDIFEAAALQIKKTDFINCIILDNQKISNLLAEGNISLTIDNSHTPHRLVCLIDTDGKRQKLICTGVSEMYCYEQDSDDFDAPYIEFHPELEELQRELMLMELTPFRHLIMTQNFLEPELFSITKLKAVPNLRNILT